jgi:hypothetical protein
MMPLREIEGIENPNYRLTYGICINIMFDGPLQI